MPIYEFKCNPDSNCVNSKIGIEILAKSDEVVKCPYCHKTMSRELSAPMGYVRGTDTPCRGNR